MSEIFIDVGPPKTASTFRQKILYPKMDVRLFVHCFNKGNVEYIDFNRDDKVILSDESLFGWVYLPSHNSVIERHNSLCNLKKWFPKAKVIVSRRDIESWKKSSFKQYIWAGGTKRYDDWLSIIYNGTWDIDGYLRLIKEYFENVLILPYNLLKESHREYSRRICDFVGVPLPDYDNCKVNVSLNNMQMEILRQSNKIWWTHLHKGIPGFRIFRGLLYYLSSKDQTL